MNRCWKFLVIGMTMFAAVTHTAMAWPGASSNNPTPGITEQKAIKIAQRHFKGRVLAINQTDHTYRVKILSDQGSIHIILIDAHDGAVVATH